MRKKILFIAPDLNSGGSQKFLLNLINSFESEKYKTYLFLKSYEGDFINSLSQSIVVLHKNKFSALGSVFELVKIMRKLKPDVSFSILNRTNLLNIICSIISFSRHKIIIRESNSPSIQWEKNNIPRRELLLGKVLYRFADIIVAQSTAMRKDILSFYNLSERKVVRITNPIDKNINSLAQEALKLDENKLNIICVGRLEKQKGYPLLFNSLFILKSKSVDFHCYVCGETNTTYSTKIFNCLKDLDLNDFVTFLGFEKNPYKFMKNCEVFVLTSLWEGLPNVVLEARSLGIPVVVTNTVEEYSEIIKSNDGIITDFNPVNIANAICTAKNFSPTRFENLALNSYQKLFENV